MSAVTGQPERRFNREVFAQLWANPKIPSKRIAAAMGITRQGASWHAHQMGLPSREKVRLVKHDPALLAEMWLAKVASAEIAAHFGLAYPTCVTKAARAAGLPPRKRGASGRRNGGWEATITLAEFFEAKRIAEMQSVMARDAREAAAQFRLAEMVDIPASRRRAA